MTGFYSHHQKIDVYKRQCSSIDTLSISENLNKIRSVLPEISDFKHREKTDRLYTMYRFTLK